jgi:precorrin-6A/cobalt-precorrin-6A reductase
MRILILGGTSEASALSRRIVALADIDATLSLAGRTAQPAPQAIPTRIGGFGGVEGLKHYLRDQRIEAVIDATHPFAAQMTAHAVAACQDLAIPLAILSRPPWHPQTGDDWVEVTTMEQAVAALGAAPRRVFLTVGALQLAHFAAAPQHHYLVRTIDPPKDIGALPDHRLILARGPFGLDDEIDLMRDHRIDVLVSKNSGGGATAAKLQAARQCGVKIIMVQRPARPDAPHLDSIDQILAWLARHQICR